jgi:hypothetical protein
MDMPLCPSMVSVALLQSDTTGQETLFLMPKRPFIDKFFPMFIMAAPFILILGALWIFTHSSQIHQWFG